MDTILAKGFTNAQVNTNNSLTPPLWRDLVKILTIKLWHTSSFLLERTDFENLFFEFQGRLTSATSTSSEGAQGIFSKITFLKSVRSNEKDEVCHSFLVEIFTKSLHRGGVLQIALNYQGTPTRPF